MVAIRFVMYASVLLGVITHSMVAAAQTPDDSIKDLEYGEVLFHFYQDDYFSALSHLMAAKEKRQINHHQDEAQLLLGGLQLSYGMRHHAEQQFQKVLYTTADTGKRNHAWYYVSKAAYQHGDMEHALQTLNRIVPTQNADAQNKIALLKASAQMKLEDNVAAARTLGAAIDSSPLRPYLEINQGIALLREGNLKEGKQLLDKFDRFDAKTEEAQALLDRANLALGYKLLQEGDAEDSLRYLNRVRLKGALSNAALLGAGWANAQQEQYEAALTPWLELQKRAHFDIAVQESYLAVPYAFAKLGDTQRAIHFYENSITYYHDEVEQVRSVIQAVESESFIEALSAVEHEEINADSENQYLVDLLAENSFQKDLKAYRELNDLKRRISHWHQNIDVLRDLVSARRAAYKQRAPVIAEQLKKNQSEQVRTHWEKLRLRISSQSESPNPIDLSSSKELQQLRLFQGIEHLLTRLPDEPRYKKIAERSKWLKGVLHWNIQDEYKQRLWNATKTLKEVESSSHLAQTRHSDIEQLLAKAHNGFEGYESRIDTLLQRLRSLLPEVLATQTKMRKALKTLALEELAKRESRLQSYQSQARLALARSYDALSRREESSP